MQISTSCFSDWALQRAVHWYKVAIIVEFRISPYFVICFNQNISPVFKTKKVCLKCKIIHVFSSIWPIKKSHDFWHIFCNIPKPHTYIRISEYSVRRQMALLDFFLPPMLWRVSKPCQSVRVEWHQTGAFEGRSTHWATAAFTDTNKA